MTAVLPIGRSETLPASVRLVDPPDLRRVRTGTAPALARLASRTGAVVDLLTCAGAALVLAPLPSSPGLEATAGAVLALAWVALVARSRPARRGPGAVGAQDVCAAVDAGLRLTAVVLVLAVALDLRPEPVTTIAFVGVVVVASVGRRWLSDRIRARSRSMAASQRTVVVGDGPDLDRVVAELESADSRLAVVARCTLPGGPDLDRVLEVVADHHAEAVVVAPGVSDAGWLRRLGWELEGRGTGLYLASGLTRVGPARTRLTHVGVLPLLHVAPADLRGPGHVVKRGVERALAGVALVLLSPLLVSVALLVRTTSSGPAFYRQTRVGLGGQPFTMLKFRTMTIGADASRRDLLESGAGPRLLFKMREDPRVTRLGRLLRRSSLDELPQLLNIVRGDMALVGPRPALPCEADLYDEDARRRLVVRPGLTGLWQVSGRSDLTWEQAVRLDLRYIEGWSLGMDLWIALRTVGAVLGRRGAY
jgi:exopolysaccharide biosynthesis polyprenyl glycosylphosphotransferase